MFNWLDEVLGPEGARQCLSSFPVLINHRKENFEQKVQQLLDLGIPKEAIPKLMVAGALNYSVQGVVVPKIKVWVNLFKQDLSNLIKFPEIFRYSILDRLLPRFYFLASKGLLKEENGFHGSFTAYRVSDPKFAGRFAESNIEAFKKFRRSLHEQWRQDPQILYQFELPSKQIQDFLSNKPYVPARGIVTKKVAAPIQ
jgi:hypothetical protein